MATVDAIKSGLIDKIQSIDNKEFLLTLENLVSTSLVDDRPVEFTEEQELMLQMSEADILNGDTISESLLKTKTDEWLKEKRG